VCEFEPVRIQASTGELVERGAFVAKAMVFLPERFRNGIRFTSVPTLPLISHVP
jgi:hypothetical protein